MSIINEAIKKARLEKESQIPEIFRRGSSFSKSYETPTISEDSININIKKPKYNFVNFKNLLALWVTSCILLVLGFLTIFSSHNSRLESPQSIVDAKLSQNPVSVSDQYKLTGIFFDSSKSFAIINDEIVWVNSAINGGARVKSINKDSVKLILGTYEIELPYNNK